MIIRFNEIIKRTEKAVLVLVKDKVTWLPLKCIVLKDTYADVPEWLYDKLVWQPNITGVDYVVSESEAEQIKRKLHVEEACDNIDPDYYVGMYDESDIPY